MKRGRLAILLVAVAALLLTPRALLAVSEVKGRRLAWELEGWRSAIEMYRAQHYGYSPGYVVRDGEYTPVVDSEFIVMQLTGYTDVAGKISLIRNRRSYPFGPYMGVIPASPLGGKAGPRSIAVVPPGRAVADEGDGSTAWLYRIKTGSLRANSPDEAPDGSRYWDW